MNITEIAVVAHEINMSFCQSIGDDSQVAWDNAHDWQRSAAIEGVKFHLDNPDATPSSSHEKWMADKIEQGWKYGLTKDGEKKEHPAILPYDQLPTEQKSKDFLFKQVVHSLHKFIES